MSNCKSQGRVQVDRLGLALAPRRHVSLFSLQPVPEWLPVRPCRNRTPSRRTARTLTTRTSLANSASSTSQKQRSTSNPSTPSAQKSSANRQQSTSVRQPPPRPRAHASRGGRKGGRSAAELEPGGNHVQVSLEGPGELTNCFFLPRRNHWACRVRPSRAPPTRPTAAEVSSAPSPLCSHGKSQTVKAISGVQTVRFKNELERNITIKLGYANAKVRFLFRRPRARLPVRGVTRTSGSRLCRFADLQV